MTKASSTTTIKANEAEHFGKLGAEWWDPNGTSAMLHKLNPVRLSFVRTQIDMHFGTDMRDLKPLKDQSVLDVGCGAGLLCEPLSRLGGDVIGVDAAPENAKAAMEHAQQSGLSIDYRSGELAEQGLDSFDLVTAMEVIEHVADPAEFISQLKAHMKPDGLLIMSTPNRTTMSKLLLVEAAERMGHIPRGTHHWDQFITPEELEEMLAAQGLEVTMMQGIAFSPANGLHLSDNMTLNYILAARLS